MEYDFLDNYGLNEAEVSEIVKQFERQFTKYKAVLEEINKET